MMIADGNRESRYIAPKQGYKVRKENTELNLNAKLSDSMELQRSISVNNPNSKVMLKGVQAKHPFHFSRKEAPALKDAKEHYKGIGKRTDGMAEKNMQATHLGDGKIRELTTCKFIIDDRFLIIL